MCVLTRGEGSWGRMVVLELKIRTEILGCLLSCLCYLLPSTPLFSGFSAERGGRDWCVNVDSNGKVERVQASVKRNRDYLLRQNGLDRIVLPHWYLLCFQHAACFIVLPICQEDPSMLFHRRSCPSRVVNVLGIWPEVVLHVYPTDRKKLKSYIFYAATYASLIFSLPPKTWATLRLK